MAFRSTRCWVICNRLRNRWIFRSTPISKVALPRRLRMSTPISKVALPRRLRMWRPLSCAPLPPASPVCRSRTRPAIPRAPLFDFALAVERVAAARRAIDDSGTRVLLTGRSEGFIVGRPDLAENDSRLVAYAEAGAECLYAPGIRTKERDCRGGERGGTPAGQRAWWGVTSRQWRSWPSWACGESAWAARWHGPPGAGFCKPLEKSRGRARSAAWRAGCRLGRSTGRSRLNVSGITNLRYHYGTSPLPTHALQAIPTGQ